MQLCSTIPTKIVSVAVHGDDFVCLSDDDWTQTLKHINKTSQIQIHSERRGNTGIRRVRRDESSVVEPCCESWDRKNGYGNATTKTVTTT